VTTRRETPSSPESQSEPRAAVRAVVAAVRWRPWLWPELLVEGLRLARPGWWHRWPPVPVPDPGLWKFRLETAYGGTGETLPEPRDIRTFLSWCRSARGWRR